MSSRRDAPSTVAPMNRMLFGTAAPVRAMSDVCHNCGKWVGDQSALQTWEAVCPLCGQLVWLRTGQVVPCKVARLLRFGIVAELGDGVEGLIHMSELAADPIDNPSEAVAIGEIVRAKVLRIDLEERKVGLSIKRVSA